MNYDKRHGGPYDRGSADAYYYRGYNPHYFKGSSYNSEMVELKDMTAEEITDMYTADLETLPNKKVNQKCRRLPTDRFEFAKKAIKQLREKS